MIEISIESFGWMIFGIGTMFGVFVSLFVRWFLQ